MSVWIRPVMLGAALAASIALAAGCRSNSTGESDTSPAPGGDIALEKTVVPAPRPAGEAGTERPAASQSATDEESRPLTARPQPASGKDAALATPFPPTMSDTEWHRAGWVKNDCLRCHETGVGDAPRVVHGSLPPLALQAKCRSCHVLVPGQKPRRMARKTDAESFAANAFPPMIPASGSHRDTWTRDDCLLCHESGIRGAPVVEHRGLPRLLLKVKCRSCHVQVRAIEGAGEP